MEKNTVQLKQTQHLFWQVITALEGDEKTVRETFSKIKPLIRGDKTLSVIDRLNIYSIAYFHRILDSLKEDFKGILKIIGDEAFHQFISDYLTVHPSTSFTLRDVGKHLSDFLKSHSLSQERPFLSDMARLEWEIIEAFDAPDSPVLSQKELGQFKPEEWGRLLFELVPSLKLISASWRVDQAREKTLKGMSPKKVKKESISIRIWRHDFKIYYRPLDPLEVKLIKQIQKGNPFENLCHEVGKQMDFEKAVPFVASKLKNWLDDGMLASAQMAK